MNTKLGEDSTCPFCSPEVLSLQVFYQDAYISILYSRKPFFPGHCLIVPKRHLERFEHLSTDEICAISTAIKKLHPVVMTIYGNSSYLLIQKNGEGAGQTVPHLHVHYIPVQYRSKKVRFFRLVVQLLGYIFFKKINSFQMKSIVEKLKKGMTS